MKSAIFGGSAIALAATLNAPAIAHDVRADDHAPIGVMGDHAHNKGEVMFSLRHMHMAMSGSQIGTDDVSPEQIVTTVPNRFSGMPMMPPTLRIVPTEMRVDMTMLGAMYAPSDDVTLMVMGSYVQKEMEHTTFQGGMGTNVLGTFQTSPEGFGDVKVSALFPLLGHPEKMADRTDELTLQTGVSIPTGSTSETAQILTPMGGTPTVRVPYAMQIGTGTWDLMPALTYKGVRGKIGFGAQARGTVRLGENSQGYAHGDRFEATSWISYRADQAVSFSVRGKFATQGTVDGIDALIVGPVQTANPDFQGGERADVIAGVNFVVTHGALAGHRLGIELGAPIWQDLNGPQMTGDWMLTVGWQKAF